MPRFSHPRKCRMLCVTTYPAVGGKCQPHNHIIVRMLLEESAAQRKKISCNHAFVGGQKSQRTKRISSAIGTRRLLDLFWISDLFWIYRNLDLCRISDFIRICFGFWIWNFFSNFKIRISNFILHPSSLPQL